MVAMRDSSGTTLAVGRFTDWEPLGFEAGDENWYRFVANGPTAKTDPSGLDRYRLGGNHPFDHSIVCVDLYDSHGIPTGWQYCCDLGGVGGSGGSSCVTAARDMCEQASLVATACCVWAHPAKIHCGERRLTKVEKANQRIASNSVEDEQMLRRLKQDEEARTYWHPLLSNCHDYAVGRLYCGCGIK